MEVNQVHYAIYAVFAIGCGLFTPPFGVGVCLARGTTRVWPELPIRRLWPHLPVVFLVLLLITSVPWLSIGSFDGR